MQDERSRRRPTGHVKVIDRKGGPAFYLKTRVPGRDPEQTTRLLGPVWSGRGRPAEGHFTRRMAEAELQDFLAAARRGQVDGLRPTRDGATFADAAAEYLRYVRAERQAEDSTADDYEGVLRGDGYLLATFGDRALASITPDDVDAYKRRLLDEGRLSNRTIVRHLTVLHGVFKRAGRVWGLERNPASADLVERPRVRYSGEFRLLEPEDLQALVRAARDSQDGAVYLAASWTGLRQGELLALRWRDVDFANQRVHVRRNFTAGREKAPKSGKVRSVPLVPELVPVLDGLSRRPRFVEPGDLVFCSEVGGHLDGWALRRRFYRALDDAGLGHLREGERPFVFHDLRHCFGSTAAKVFELADVQAMLGHAHVTTTMRYVHHRPGAEDAARLSAAFSGLQAESAPERVPSAA